jgi:hypothetical protein
VKHPSTFDQLYLIQGKITGKNHPYFQLKFELQYMYAICTLILIKTVSVLIIQVLFPLFGQLDLPQLGGDGKPGNVDLTIW